MATITGTEGADTLTPTHVSAGLVFPGDGPDSVAGLGGDDRLDGGGGNDSLLGRDGAAPAPIC